MKKKLEKDIQLEICQWLKENDFYFWRFRYMSRFPIKFIPRGLPDIMILHQGKFIGLEIKVPGYWKYTDDQIAMKDLIISNGGRYHLITSLEEAQKIL